MASNGRTGHCDYAKVIRALWSGAKSTDDIARVIGITPRSASNMLCALWSQRIIHVKTWVLRVARYSPMWAAGDKPDAALPDGIKQRIHPKVRAEAVSFGVFWRTLLDGASAADLREETGISQGTMRILIAKCRELSIVRIRGWRRPPRNMGDSIPIYGVGATKDAPKPIARPKAELDSQAWVRYKNRQAAMRLASVFRVGSTERLSAAQS